MVFDEWARRGRAEGMARTHGPVAQRALDRLALAADARFVDVGCGNGYVVRWAAAAAPRGRAVGLDASPEMIASARRASAAYPNAEFHLTAFPTHPLPRGRWDAIFSMEVLYYLPDLATALAEITRLLVPGGRFANVVDYYGENTASHGWPEEVGVPMTLLTAAEWRQAFHAAGLAVIEQDRIRLPAEEASERWKTDVGSLVTIGRRAA